MDPYVWNKTIRALAGLEPQPDWIKESPTKAGSRYNELRKTAKPRQAKNGEKVA